MVNNIFVLRTIILLKDTTQFEKKPKANKQQPQTNKKKTNKKPHQIKQTKQTHLKTIK